MSRKEYSYSLWLMPRGEKQDKMRKMTERLSKQYNSPRIDPHVTLVGGFGGDIEEFVYTAEKLSKNISPFVISLSEIDQMDDFFRCLFLKAEKTHELMSAYKLATDAYAKFDLKYDPENYLPHMSLMYGDFSRDEKNTIIKDLRNSDQSASFVANKLYAVINNEKNKLWPIVESFDLKYINC